MNFTLIKRRLGWYGLAWLGSFVAVLLICVVGFYFFEADIVDLADILIPVGLGLLALGLIGVVIRDLVSRHSAMTKIAILLLALLLILPLLWAPVAASAVAALIAQRSIEYSQAYAQFRIVVSNLLFPLMDALVSGAAFDLAWKAFQLVGAFVGFLSSALQVLGFIRKLMAGRIELLPASDDAA